VHADADALPGSQPAGVTFAPVSAGGAVVKEVSVNVDEHPSLPLFLLFGLVLGQTAESRFVLIADCQIEIGLSCYLFLQRTIFIIDIVEAIDGWLAR
jgi:hypothetical protein